MIYEIREYGRVGAAQIMFCANCRGENQAATSRKTIIDSAFRLIEGYPMRSRVNSLICPICAVRELEYEFTKLPRVAISRSVVITPQINPAVFDQNYIGQVDAFLSDVIRTRFLLDRNWFYIVENSIAHRLKTFALAGPAHTLACTNRLCPACGRKTTRKLAGIIVRYEADDKVKNRLLCSSCSSVIVDHYKSLLLICERILRRAER